VNIDTRKWFDRSQPQTLQIATFLLYLNGFFALIDFLDKAGWLGAARVRDGSLGVLIGLVVIASYALGGLLMANDRKLGYYVALFAGFSPFLLRFWTLRGIPGVDIFDKIKGGRLISFIFEVALCALLLHTQSRDHQRVWFK
jgi:hypothetical protein